MTAGEKKKVHIRFLSYGRFVRRAEEGLSDAIAGLLRSEPNPIP